MLVFLAEIQEYSWNRNEDELNKLACKSVATGFKKEGESGMAWIPNWCNLGNILLLLTLCSLKMPFFQAKNHIKIS